MFAMPQLRWRVVLGAFVTAVLSQSTTGRGYTKADASGYYYVHHRQIRVHDARRKKK
jgi:hypothetical protein